MDWRQFTMNLDSLQAEKVEQVFELHGAHAVTLSNAGDQWVLEPAPGEMPLGLETKISGPFSAVAYLLSLRHDPQHACGLDSASWQHAMDNGVSNLLQLTTESGDFCGEYAVVVANILAGTLIEVAIDLSKRTVHGGMLALSGILSEQIEIVSDAYERWITLDPAVVRNNRARITGTLH